MCFIPGLDPITMTMVSAGVSAAGSLASGAMQASGYRAQSAGLARQSQMEQQRGAYERGRTMDSNTRQLDRMRGQYLSSGIALEGSAQDVIEDSATEASLDEQAIRYGAQVRSDNLMFESKMARMNAGSAMIGGALGALSSVVGGLSQQADQNSQLQVTRDPYRTVIRNPYAIGGGLY